MNHLEALTEQAYNPSSAQARQQAIEALEAYATGADASKTLMLAISQSQVPSAVHYAATAMLHVYTNFLNTFSLQDRRSMLVNVFMQRAEWICSHDILRPKIGDLAARVWRLSWFEMAGSDTDADAIEDATMVEDMRGAASQSTQDPLLHDVARNMLSQTQSLPHMLLGCTLLHSLVRDMSQHLSHFSGARQRKIAVAFRDKALLDVLGLALNTLNTIRTSGVVLAQSPQFELLLRGVLELIAAAFNFDFIGTMPDDSSEDASIIHVPASWSTVMEDTNTLKMFFEVYHQYQPPISTLVLEILVSMVSVRNSIFRNSEIRSTFLACIFAGIGEILQSKKDLSNENNRHQICRLLLRLKANYQLTHLVKIDTYKNFIELVAAFHLQVFESDALSNSIYYVLLFWSRMISATTYLPDDCPPNHLDVIAPQILIGFLKGQIQAEATLDPAEDSLLDDKQLPQLLETMPKLAYQGDYRMIVQYLISGLEHLGKQFLEWTTGHASNKNPNELCTLEKQLAWVVHVIASITFGRAIISQEEVDTYDAQLICSTFDMLKLNDQRVNMYGPTPKTAYLEVAFVAFLRKFSRIYFTDPSLERSQVHTMLAERHGLTSPSQIIEAILAKIAMNLKMWTQTDLSGDTLDLFHLLATGRASSELLSKSALVSQIIAKHNELNLGSSKRTRCAFYNTLSKLIFPSVDYEQFDNFVQPFDQKLTAIAEAYRNGVLNESLGNAVAEVLTDLRGVLSSCFGQKGYEMFFDWFYAVHNYFASVIVPTIQLMPHKHWKSVWVTMQFVNELTTNRHRRIQFPNTSADGLRLFRDTANVLLMFGQTLMSITVPPNKTEGDELDIRFKGLLYYLSTFSELLIGEYANLGVFQLYNDPILQQLLNMTYTLIFSVDYHQLRAYPKTHEALYVAIEMIAVHDVGLLYLNASPSQAGGAPTGPTNGTIMTQLLLLLRQGLRSSRVRITCCSATALDKIVSHQLEKLLRRRNSPPTVILDASHQPILMAIMFDLFDVLLNDRDNVHWSLSKPLFSLIMMLPEAFQQLKDMMVKSQAAVSEEKAVALMEQFTKLTAGVERNLKPENRERFTSNCTSFRMEVKNFIDFNALYKGMQSFVD